MKKLILAVSLAVVATAAVHAGPPAPKTQGIESKDYKWNAQEGEKSEALKLKGDAKRGEEAYEVCGACHLPSGAGRPDGTFPQLAGQHTTVLIKQMADIRAGLRDNPTMYPFAALPRFAMRPESVAYAETFQSLGMRLAFDATRADFSGIGAGATPAENPALTMVYQRVSLAVSEVGGDGSVNAPLPGMGDAGVRPGGAVAVRFDRPFLFAVRDPMSGLVLLLGRVVDPGA